LQLIANFALEREYTLMTTKYLLKLGYLRII
jgi:hypothetical protein